MVGRTGHVESDEGPEGSAAVSCGTEGGDGYVSFDLLWRAPILNLTRNSKKGMSGEEDMVLSHIQAAGNLGTPFLNKLIQLTHSESCDSYRHLD